MPQPRAQLSDAKELAALWSRTWVKGLLAAAGGGRDGDKVERNLFMGIAISV
jgi:hypothetical protein